MEKWLIDVPVVLFFFNREETTRRVFEQIRNARPRQLFLISDGARADRSGEKEKVEKLRTLSKEVDWECQLFTYYAEHNMGCDKRIKSGLDMVFKQVDCAIILEDDCLPTLQFFDFCRDMLEKYKNQKEIAYIAGGTYVKIKKRKFSYFFAKVGSTWGWATWKDRWLDFMITPEKAMEKAQDCLRGILSEQRRIAWLDSAERHFSQEDYPWDYLWQIGTNEMLRIVPSVNLVSNIGFSGESTHTLMKPNGYYGKLGKIKTPYIHPDLVQADEEYLREYEYRTKNRIWNKMIAKSILLLYAIRQRNLERK